MSRNVYSQWITLSKLKDKYQCQLFNSFILVSFAQSPPACSIVPWIDSNCFLLLLLCVCAYKRHLQTHLSEWLLIIAHTCRLKKKDEEGRRWWIKIGRESTAYYCYKENLIINVLTHHRPLRVLHPKPEAFDPVTTLWSCSWTITVSKKHSLSSLATECSLCE